MDGENVIERVLLSNIEIVRTIYPDNTMLIESVEDGVGVRVVIDADYSVFKSLYTAQQSPAFCNNEIVGSQYIHQFVGSPGTVVITKESLRNARDEAWVVSLLLSKFSYPASVAFGVAAVLYGREYENADYYEVHVTSDTYQVLFAIDHSYYIHCYHQRFEYYKENATRPYKTETDYYQAIGG